MLYEIRLSDPEIILRVVREYALMIHNLNSESFPPKENIIPRV